MNEALEHVAGRYAQALEIAQRGYVLETGTIVAQGTAQELGADEDVRKAYLGF